MTDLLAIVIVVAAAVVFLTLLVRALLREARGCREERLELREAVREGLAILEAREGVIAAARDHVRRASLCTSDRLVAAVATLDRTERPTE